MPGRRRPTTKNTLLSAALAATNLLPLLLLLASPSAQAAVAAHGGGSSSSAAAQGDAKTAAAADAIFRRKTLPITVPRPTGNTHGKHNNKHSSQKNERIALAYRNMRARLHNTRYDAERPGPALYEMPGTPEALRSTIAKLNAKGRRWLVHGGGHSYEATTLPTGTDATVIDLARFDGVTIGPPDGADGSSAVTFGAGLRLGELYYLLSQRGLVLVAGSCKSNGASGYLLGGGIGQTTRRHGWGSDNVISAKLVTADGAFAVAGPDDALARPGQRVTPRALLWALRGGGTGTAVVYEWTVRAYPAPTSVVTCVQAFDTSSDALAAGFVDALFNKWDPGANLDGFEYPLIMYRFKGDTGAIELNGYDVAESEVRAELENGMASGGGGAPAIGKAACRSFTWPEYIVFFAIEFFNGPAAAAAIQPLNFTAAALLSADYLGWPGGQPAPLSPYGGTPIDPPPESIMGPWSFTAQGAFSDLPWTADAAVAARAAAIAGAKVRGYILGGAASEPYGPAAQDGVGSVSSQAWGGQTSLAALDVALDNVEAVAAADALVAAIHSASASKGPLFFYNFLSCFGKGTSSDRLYELYYAGVDQRLKMIKKSADPSRRLRTWCDV